MDDSYRAGRVKILVQLRRQYLADNIARLGDKITKENADDLMSRITEASVNPHFPMKEFEERTGLTGLSFDYKMPDGKDASIVEIDYEIMRLESGVLFDRNRSPNAFDFKPGVTSEQRQVYLCYARDLIASLKHLNPELSGIALEQDNVDQGVDFILGVTSGYNPDDIAYYLSKEWSNPDGAKTFYQRALRGKLKEVFDDVVYAYGMTSPQTAQKICQQLEVLRPLGSAPKPS